MMRHPAIRVAWLIGSEGDIVVAEGRVRATRRDGGVLNVVFCDVFEMRDGQVRKLTSYLMAVQAE